MYMTQGLRRAAKLKPNDIAMLGDGLSINWAEFQDRTARLAGAFAKLGLKQGDRVAMLGLNSHRYVEFFYGSFWAGVAAVPLNIRWAVAEHIYALNDCGARALIVDDAFAGIAADIATGVPSIEVLIHATDGAPADNMHSHNDLIANHAAVPRRLAQRRRSRRCLLHWRHDRFSQRRDAAASGPLDQFHRFRRRRSSDA